MTPERIRRGVTLTEEQWRQAKAHAAQRGETISQYFAYLLAENTPRSASPKHEGDDRDAR